MQQKIKDQMGLEDQLRTIRSKYIYIIDLSRQFYVFLSLSGRNLRSNTCTSSTRVFVYFLRIHNEVTSPPLAHAHIAPLTSDKLRPRQRFLGDFSRFCPR